MTYREILLKDLSGEEIDEEKNRYRTSFSTCDFILSMSNVLIHVAKVLLAREAPTISAGRETVENGKAIDEPTSDDLAFVIGGPSLGRGSVLRFSLYDFVDWLLDQDVDEESLSFFSASGMAEKWNEYQMKKE